jgi:hypothetical protein
MNRLLKKGLFLYPLFTVGVFAFAIFNSSLLVQFAAINIAVTLLVIYLVQIDSIEKSNIYYQNTLVEAYLFLSIGLFFYALGLNSIISLGLFIIFMVSFLSRSHFFKSE